MCKGRIVIGLQNDYFFHLCGWGGGGKDARIVHDKQALVHMWVGDKVVDAMRSRRHESARYKSASASIVCVCSGVAPQGHGRWEGFDICVFSAANDCRQNRIWGRGGCESVKQKKKNGKRLHFRLVCL